MSTRKFTLETTTVCTKLEMPSKLNLNLAVHDRTIFGQTFLLLFWDELSEDTDTDDENVIS